MTIVITTKEPRPDWNNKNVKRITSKEVDWLAVDENGVSYSYNIVNEAKNYNIVAGEIANIVITY